MIQTLLPFHNIYPSISCLSDEHLCEQRVNAKKILDTLENKSKTHRHHPAVKMWKGNEELLRGYLSSCITQWIKRGHSNNMESPRVQHHKIKLPLWWGGYIHSSHRAYLLRENPKHYAEWGWKINLATPVFWPIRHNGQLK